MLYRSATVIILPKIPGIGKLIEIEIQVVGAYSVKAKEGCVLHVKSDAGFSLTQRWLSIAAVFMNSLSAKRGSRSPMRSRQTIT